MTCREFFEAHKGNLEVCKALQNVSLDEQLAWEGEQASSHSAGPVQDDETLCRQVVDPTHFDSVTGTIKPTFFDDAANKGASCHRLQHTSPAHIQAMADSRVEASNANPPASGPKQAIGYATVAASEVRKITVAEPAGRRGAAVYDTGQSDDPSHADVCQIVGGRQQGKSVRAQLWQLAKDRLVRFDSPAQGAVAPQPPAA